MQLTFSDGGDSNMSHIGHTSQRLSPEAHRLYRLQILISGQLRRGVPLA